MNTRIDPNYDLLKKEFYNLSNYATNLSLFINDVYINNIKDSLQPNHNEYNNLKVQIFNDVKSIYEHKATLIDQPVINLRFSFNYILQELSTIHFETATAIQQLTFSNPVANLNPSANVPLNQNTLNKQPAVQQQQPPAVQTQPTIPVQPTPAPLKKRPISTYGGGGGNNFAKPPPNQQPPSLNQQNQQQQPPPLNTPPVSSLTSNPLFNRQQQQGVPSQNSNVTPVPTTTAPPRARPVSAYPGMIPQQQFNNATTPPPTAQPLKKGPFFKPPPGQATPQPPPPQVNGNSSTPVSNQNVSTPPPTKFPVVGIPLPSLAKPMPNNNYNNSSNNNESPPVLPARPQRSMSVTTPPSQMQTNQFVSPPTSPPHTYSPPLSNAQPPMKSSYNQAFQQTPQHQPQQQPSYVANQSIAPPARSTTPPQPPQMTPQYNAFAKPSSIMSMFSQLGVGQTTYQYQVITNPYGYPETTIDELMFNHEQHKKMWHKRFMMTREYVITLRCVRDVIKEIESGPYTHIKLFVCAPISFQGQDIKAWSYKVVCHTSGRVMDQPKLLPAPGLHPIYMIDYANTTVKGKFTVSTVTDVDMYRNALKEVGPDDHVEYYQLSDEERYYYTQPNEQCNFNEPAFTAFIQEHLLYPIQFQDGTTESIICFCYRVSLFIKKHISYEINSGGQKPLETFKKKLANCGSYAALFTSITRYHGIPTRSYSGISVYPDKTSRSSDGREIVESGRHAQTEFFYEGLWIPYCGSVITNDVYNSKAFGETGILTFAQELNAPNAHLEGIEHFGKQYPHSLISPATSYKMSVKGCKMSPNMEKIETIEKLN
ncbi:hydroxyproline-rich glycoprotein [Heterostelium album PN500]|uniref:Hydroxyproline-rich glycoprotein n=1 Tax=Heterostelium pallidum (strain ATCC 26659 / Pp 5 / PN500) TaxID=670386 RepID=D3AXJ4_HETP5|nr:hydroxyproline-rich glycoprotein [Heterostelium album PN500]EFA86263.1 hydroxyproline-rich glycoprotein [Heterostelium album PN500]|eukprot:XP_020438368.1 hydroxyproline-rich glycoprotein [Heterostelium album PN500]